MTRLLQHISYLSFIVAFMMIGDVRDELELHTDLLFQKGIKQLNSV